MACIATVATSYFGFGLVMMLLLTPFHATSATLILKLLLGCHRCSRSDTELEFSSSAIAGEPEEASQACLLIRHLLVRFVFSAVAGASEEDAQLRLLISHMLIRLVFEVADAGGLAGPLSFDLAHRFLASAIMARSDFIAVAQQKPTPSVHFTRRMDDRAPSVASASEDF